MSAYAKRRATTLAAHAQAEVRGAHLRSAQGHLRAALDAPALTYAGRHAVQRALWAVEEGLGGQPDSMFGAVGALQVPKADLLKPGAAPADAAAVARALREAAADLRRVPWRTRADAQRWARRPAALADLARRIEGASADTRGA
jgi:hypothetical protein